MDNVFQRHFLEMVLLFLIVLIVLTKLESAPNEVIRVIKSVPSFECEDRICTKSLLTSSCSWKNEKYLLKSDVFN